MFTADNDDTFADRVAMLTRQLAAQDSPLALGLWERGTAVRIGRVTQAIKGASESIRRIEDGYQYVGGMPAHMWRAATADKSYKTLSYGISTFWQRWGSLASGIEVPCQYISIGPGTGEKDGTIIRHLQAQSDDQILYIPVDISADLLRMSLDVSLQGVDAGRINVLPVELDITSEVGLEGLHRVTEVMADGPVLLSLLGNTVGNFREDKAMLARIANLLSSREDMLLLEVATTEKATEELAQLAGDEYAGSVSFRNFVMAALSQYTNLTTESGVVEHQGRVSGRCLEVATVFTAGTALDIYVNDNDHFVLPPDQSIELYRSRKYTEGAFAELIGGFTVLRNSQMPYSREFGILTSALKVAA
jgi:L-histidine Nalpha-methyltransferase